MKLTVHYRCLPLGALESELWKETSTYLYSAVPLLQSQVESLLKQQYPLMQIWSVEVVKIETWTSKEV